MRQRPGGATITVMAALASTRTAIEALEIRAPALAAGLARLVGRLPGPVRRRVLAGAFERARHAFDRGDLEALFALFDDDVDYVPPPPLEARPIRGRADVCAFWRATLDRWPQSTITNLSLVEAAPNRFVREASIEHRDGDGNALTYEIRQTTTLRAGRVVRQVNEAR
jgi:ketosteroid isomerase-like protein